MQAQVSNALFLSGERVSFTGRNGDQVEFQRGEFYVRGGGGSATFNVDKSVDVDGLEEMTEYDLVLDLDEQRNGNSVAYKVRVVSAVPSF